MCNVYILNSSDTKKKKNPYDVGTIIIPILQIKKQVPRS